MDDLRFDGLARALGRAGSRREGLKAALGGLFGIGAAGTALDAEAKDRRGTDRDRDRDQAAADEAGAADDGAGDARRKRKKTCKPACTDGYTCVKTGRKRKKRFSCQCLSGVTCGAACCAAGETCEGGACTGGPEPVDCHRLGEFCKQTGRPCCSGLTCGSGQQGEDDIGCWAPKGGACASTAECTWGTECRDGVCGPLLCGPANCDGCCTATAHGMCIGGRDQTDAQCGAAGAVCAACPAGKVCKEKACVCAPGTKACGDGCILDASCCTNEVEGCPTNESCRVNDRGNGRCECGQTGQSCPPSGLVCSAADNSGVCLCGGVECPSNETCVNGACACGGGATCASSQTCEPNGSGGPACVGCPSGQKPCGNSCIAATDCCTNDVAGCPATGPTTCTAGSCTCGAGTKPCGEACIPTSSCCVGGSETTDTNPCPQPSNSTCTSGTCQCSTGFKPCGAACILNGNCCENGAEFQPNATCQPSGSICNGATGACECGTNPPAICGQNSFCTQAGACVCAGNVPKCGNDCCAAFETCVNGACITTSALCGGRLCAAGQGCCSGICSDLDDWGTQAVTTFATGCMPAITCTPAPAENASRIPFYVYVAPDGLTAWVAEQVNNRVSVWTRPDTASLAWSRQANFGSTGSGNENFNNPYSVVASFDGLTAFVADEVNNRISVWRRSTPNGTDWTWQVNFGGGCTAVTTCTASQLWKPGAMAVSSDTLTVWASDTGTVGSAGARGSNGRIQIWTRPGTGSNDWTWQGNIGSYGTAANQFRRPRGIFVSPDEKTMWIADDQNSRVAVWTCSGNPTVAADWSVQTTFGSCTGNPLSGACQADGVCDGPAQFNRPLGVVASLDGTTAWVSDYCNNRISVWRRQTATSATWSPVTTFGTPLNGTSSVTGFDEPRGVWVAGDACTAWVADTQSQRISIWSAADGGSGGIGG